MKMRWILVILMTFLLIGLIPMVVIAAPPIPYRPQGTVQLNDTNVPDGTAITAFCSGVQYGYTESFTSSGVSKYTMNVSGDDPGTPEKDGCSQGETVVFKVASTIADQEGIWSSGTQTLNLTATKPVPCVSIEKKVNGCDADSSPGPYLIAGDPLTWSYWVTNSGETALTDIIVTDDNGTPGNTGDDFQVCDPFDLGIGESNVCYHGGIVQAGYFVNIAAVTGNTPEDPPVTNSDSAYYFGVLSETSLLKLTNEQDVDLVSEVYVEADGTVTWSYVVTNTGNVQLTGVNVTDDKGVTVTCPKSILEPGESMTCTASGTAVAGQYENTGTVVGVPPVGPNVSDFDLSHYFGSAPAITMLKKLNGVRYESEPGLYILVDGALTWTYELQNTGNVPLTNVTVTDDNGTPANTLDDRVACTALTLDPGATHTCTLTGTAVAGQYHNVATVTGIPPVGTLTPVQDHGYYFGAIAQFEFNYKVNTADADSPPGLYVMADSTLALDYVVSNEGNVPLYNLVVTDEGSNVCTIPSLDVSASYLCEGSLTGLVGQQSRSASVTADPPDYLPQISDSDPIYYFGATTGITVDKKTNDQQGNPDPIYVLTGSTVNWTYLVTNTSNVILSNVVVSDDNGTPTNSADDRIATGCNGISLDPGAFTTCSLSAPAQEGAYTNIALASGEPPSPLSPVYHTDSSSYFGTTLDISLVKKTNGEDGATEPGPLVAVGAPVNWTYLATNSSNVTVGISIIDNPSVTINCPVSSLAPDTSTTCTASGTAVAGQFTNTATLTATPPGGLEPVTAQDTSHYYGVTTGVTIEKKTNGIDADEAPGPFIKIGETVYWTYVIKNTGNVLLTGIVVTDDKGVEVTCPGTSLEPDQSMVCTASGTATEGQYANIGSVTANPPTGFSPVSDTDPSHYYGSDAGVSITKLTNGVDIGLYDPPYILVNGVVQWTYLVENIGNLAISDILVTDSDTSLVITCETSVLVDGQLLPGVTMTCTASGTAIEGRYDNTAYVEGSPYGFETEKVQDSDASAYFGANPSITIEKSTNGVDADLPPGPYIPVGEPITLQYEVINPETEYQFTDIQVTDDEGVMVNCPSTRLDPGDEPMICTAEAAANLGQQGFAGHVSASVILVSSDEQLGEINNSDPSHYFGYTAPGLTLTKYTNGIAVEGPPGPELFVGSSLTWTYEVTNESNAPVADLSVSDNPVGVVACEKDGLEGNETVTCSASGEVVEGQYSNTAQASGVFIPTEEGISSLVASSYYYGVRGSKLFLPLLLR